VNITSAVATLYFCELSNDKFLVSKSIERSQLFSIMKGASLLLLLCEVALPSLICSASMITEECVNDFSNLDFSLSSPDYFIASLGD